MKFVDDDDDDDDGLLLVPTFIKIPLPSEETHAQ